MEDPEADVAETATENGAPVVDGGRVEWWIKTLIANASALRNAGVSSIAIDGCSASLLPKEPPAPRVDDLKNEEQIPDGIHPLDDPRSYPGGVVPGFKIEKLPYDEE